jgi:hypothetical protein
MVNAAFDEDDEEPGEFECPECGEEPDEDDICQNEECPAYRENASTAQSDWQERQHERRQMGVEL